MSEINVASTFDSFATKAKADLKETGSKGTSKELAGILGVTQQTFNQAEKGVKAVSLDRLVGWLDRWNQTAPSGARRWAMEIDGASISLKPSYPVGFFRVVDTFNETIVARHASLNGAADALKEHQAIHGWHKIQVKTESGWADTTLEAEGYYR